MATYKVALIIKEEDKKIHLSVAEADKEFVKIKTISDSEDLKQVLGEIIAAYPEDLKEFEKKNKKISPVKTSKTKVKEEEEENIELEETKEKSTDLFQEAQKVEKEAEESPAEVVETIEEKTSVAAVSDEMADEDEMMEE